MSYRDSHINKAKGILSNIDIGNFENEELELWGKDEKPGDIKFQKEGLTGRIPGTKVSMTLIYLIVGIWIYSLLESFADVNNYYLLASIIFISMLSCLLDFYLRK